MKFWQKHRRFTSILLMGLVLVLALGCVSVDAAPNWELSNPTLIKDGDTEYFVEGDTLYRRANGKEKVIAKWDLTGYDNLSIISGYKNNINVCVVHYLPNEQIREELYTVNYKTGKKVKAIKSLWPFATYGPYIYGCVDNNYDPFYQPVYIWKASGNKMKRIGKLCTYMSGSMSIMNKKIYYGTNPGGDTSMLNVYSSNLNGKGRKELFTLKSKGGEIFVTENKNNIITVVEYIDNSQIVYKYNTKTGKLSKAS